MQVDPIPTASVHTLVLVCMPDPHVCEHAENAVHDKHEQLSEIVVVVVGTAVVVGRVVVVGKVVVVSLVVVVVVAGTVVVVAGMAVVVVGKKLHPIFAQTVQAAVPLHTPSSPELVVQGVPAGA